MCLISTTFIVLIIRFRSTKSEKLYPSMLQRSDEPDSYYSIPYASSNRSEHRTYPHASQPTSPTPVSRYNYQSPQANHRSVISSPYAASIMSKINTKDDDGMYIRTQSFCTF